MAVPSNTILTSKPSFIEFKHLKFLIMDAPKDSNLHLYLKECERHHVSDIVRISEPTYSREEVEKAGIRLHVSYIYVEIVICTINNNIYISIYIYIYLYIKFNLNIRKCTLMTEQVHHKKSLMNGMLLLMKFLVEEMKKINVLLFIVLQV